jgi:hypothetical protein
MMFALDFASVVQDRTDNPCAGSVLHLFALIPLYSSQHFLIHVFIFGVMLCDWLHLRVLIEMIETV